MAERRAESKVGACPQIPTGARCPPAARRSVEVVWNVPEPFHQLCCCGPGRSAVRRGRFQDAPRLNELIDGPWATQSTIPASACSGVSRAPGQSASGNGSRRP